MKKIIEKIIICFFKLFCKPIHRWGSFTKCKNYIYNMNIPFFIYKYKLIALSSYTQEVNSEIRDLLVLSIVNQYCWSVSHEIIIKRLINYLYLFPDFSDNELQIMYIYINRFSLNDLFYSYLNKCVDKKIIEKIQAKFLLFKLM